MWFFRKKKKKQRVEYSKCPRKLPGFCHIFCQELGIVCHHPTKQLSNNMPKLLNFFAAERSYHLEKDTMSLCLFRIMSFGKDLKRPIKDYNNYLLILYRYYIYGLSTSTLLGSAPSFVRSFWVTLGSVSSPGGAHPSTAGGARAAPAERRGGAERCGGAERSGAGGMEDGGRSVTDHLHESIRLLDGLFDSWHESS